jgi:hypothetical protein
MQDARRMIVLTGRRKVTFLKRTGNCFFVLCHRAKSASGARIVRRQCERQPVPKPSHSVHDSSFPKFNE